MNKRITIVHLREKAHFTYCAKGHYQVIIVLNLM